MVDTVRTSAYLLDSSTGTLRSNATGLITAQAMRDAVVTAFDYSAPINGGIEAPSARTYVILLSAHEAFTLTNIVTKLTAGTAALAVQINGVNVTGLSAVAVTTTRTTSTATAANTVAIGDTVSLVITSPSSADMLAFQINRTRS